MLFFQSMKNTTFLFLAPMLALVIFGAGCGSKPIVTTPPAPPTHVNDELEANLQTNETTTTSDEEAATSTMQTETPKQPLAYPGILSDEEVTNKIVRIKTAKGEIVFELLPKEGPRAASNFAYLVKNKFYDGLTFHRIIAGFMAQGGDPLGNSTGGPGYAFEDDQVNLLYNKGIVAMANAGPNTNGSQFFIMLEDYPLPPSYSIFGRVLSGQDVVSKLVIGDVMETVTLESKTPAAQ
mgnify:CR=1 FL=1